MSEALKDLPWGAPASGWKTLLARLAETGRLMVGVPDYDRYAAHMARTHPDQEPMTYTEFFRERQQARYGGGFKRCC